MEISAFVRNTPQRHEAVVATGGNEHTPSGRHVAQHVPFPEWVPADVGRAAADLDDDEAVVALAAWLPTTAPAGTARKR